MTKGEANHILAAVEFTIYNNDAQLTREIN